LLQGRRHLAQDGLVVPVHVAHKAQQVLPAVRPELVVLCHVLHQIQEVLEVAWEAHITLQNAIH